MLAALTAALCLAQAAPETLSRDDVYARAVDARLSGRADDAIANLIALLAEHPDDVDARLQLGLSYKAAGRTADATRELQAVLRRAPDYLDARTALAELTAPHGAARAPAKWRLDASAALSELSRDLPEWREANLSLSRKWGPNSALSGHVQTLERFHIHETYLEGALDRGWAGGEWSLALGGSLDPTFRPKTAVRTSLLVAPTRGSPLRLAFDADYLRYVVGDVVTVKLGADRDVFNARGSVGARLIETRTETARTLSGFSTSASWRFNNRFDAAATYVDSAESDAGATTRVKAIGLAGTYALTERASVQPSITHEQRVGGYDRLEFTLGVTVRF